MPDAVVSCRHITLILILISKFIYYMFWWLYESLLVNSKLWVIRQITYSSSSLWIPIWREMAMNDVRTESHATLSWVYFWLCHVYQFIETIHFFLQTCGFFKCNIHKKYIKFASVVGLLILNNLYAKF